MKKNAFTMIELVFAIIVLGILAALAIPRLDRDLRQEAADNILSAIRYTQHLALIDDKHKFDNPKWQRRFWRFYFGTCEDKKFFAVGSDDNMDGSTNGRVDFTESALDPSNGKHLWAKDGTSCNGSHPASEISPNVLIGKKYGVNTITPSGGCGNRYIGFDHLGRPYSSVFTNSNIPDNNGSMTADCNMTFSFSDTSIDPISIIIATETGYAYIDGEPDS